MRTVIRTARMALPLLIAVFEPAFPVDISTFLEGAGVNDLEIRNDSVWAASSAGLPLLSIDML